LSEHDVITQPSLAANLVEALLKQYSEMVPKSPSVSSASSLGEVKGREDSSAPRAAAAATTAGGSGEEGEEEGVRQQRRRLDPSKLITIQQGVETVAATIRSTKKELTTVAVDAMHHNREHNLAVEAAAKAVEKLGFAVARSFDAVNSYGGGSELEGGDKPGLALFGGDGWRLLLKV
jgi:hypothetical protein